MGLFSWLKKRVLPGKQTGLRRTARQVSGAWGEAHAAAFLEKAGYRIIGRNVRLNRHDELDIIARKGAMTVFVEVKTRANEVFGRPVVAVNETKRRRMRRAATAWLRQNDRLHTLYRFDVVEVVGAPQKDKKPQEIRHLEAIDMTRTRSPFH